MEDRERYFANTQIVIHVGGMSERWYPVTHGKIPKALTPIGKNPKPIIEWTIYPYVKAGVKEFFITLWNQPEMILDHCNRLSEKTGIKFHYLNEEGKRMGRAGVVKHYLEKGVLSKEKNIVMIGGSDIVNIDLEEFTKTHMKNVSNGFIATLIGSSSGQTQFDKMVFDPKTGQVKKYDVDRTIILDDGQCANTGTAYFDASANNLFLGIKEERMPIDWENLINEFGKVNCLLIADVYKNWIPLKTPYDYKKANDIDFEKWFGINSIE